MISCRSHTWICERQGNLRSIDSMQYAFNIHKSRPYEQCSDSEQKRKLGVARTCVEQGMNINSASYVSGVPVNLIKEEILGVSNNIS